MVRFLNCNYPSKGYLATKPKGLNLKGKFQIKDKVRKSTRIIEEYRNKDKCKIWVIMRNINDYWIGVEFDIKRNRFGFVSVAKNRGDLSTEWLLWMEEPMLTEYNVESLIIRYLEIIKEKDLKEGRRWIIKN